MYSRSPSRNIWPTPAPSVDSALARAGARVAIYNRTTGRAQALIAALAHPIFADVRHAAAETLAALAPLWA